MHKNYDDFKKEILKDPETKAEYDDLESEYYIIQKSIDAKNIKSQNKKQTVNNH